MDPEAIFWRQRYLELVQNHTQVVALMARRDQQAEQAQKLGAIGEALQKRVQDAKDANGQAPEVETEPEPPEPAAARRAVQKERPGPTLA